MDINLLAISVGNSRLALGTFIAGELTKVARLSHAQRAVVTFEQCVGHCAVRSGQCARTINRPA